MMTTPRSRPGTTLIELLIFVAILGMSIGVIFPVLYTTVENRMLQQTVAVVEQNGAQLLQITGLRIRESERVLDPAMGQTGSVLALQTGSGASTPTIIGVESGALVIIRHTTKRTLSSPQVAITNVTFRNTSTSADHQSVLVRFTATRTIRLQSPHSYTEMFQGLFTLLPDDRLAESDCSCTPPVCQAQNSYIWQVCESTICATALAGLTCP